ncbi:hypothetical protein GUJ93_ZPchr0144g33477 [Zizania palustris]|uniref:Uncharacterized protein n=1 Tax=Zizania palustris TaxID=103762 RepID=A0A8J5RFA9_ZIZPA|nr:hypothetical protein GUJ93_ZPchr0144g33477 [Zizania palustris]
MRSGGGLLGFDCGDGDLVVFRVVRGVAEDAWSTTVPEMATARTAGSCGAGEGLSEPKHGEKPKTRWRRSGTRELGLKWCGRVAVGLRKGHLKNFPVKAINEWWYSDWILRWFYAEVSEDSSLVGPLQEICGQAHEYARLGGGVQRFGGGASRDRFELSGGSIGASSRANSSGSGEGARAPTTMEKQRRMELVGSWERSNRVWSALGIEAPPLPSFDAVGLVSRKRKSAGGTSKAVKILAKKVAWKAKLHSPPVSPPSLDIQSSSSEESKEETSEARMGMELEALLMEVGEGDSRAETEDPPRVDVGVMSAAEE